MQQPELWFDRWEDALRSVLISVYGKGWAQKAAANMSPTDDPIARGKWLEHALNPERAEKLALAEIVWILRLGRQHGYHDAMFYLTDEASYQRPIPITPEQRRDALREEAAGLAERLESVVRELRRVS